MKLVSIDPGVHHCGLALFDEGRLVDARLIREHEDIEPKMACGIEHSPVAIYFGGTLVVERPKVYIRGYANPQDLLDLDYTVGTIVGLLAGRFRKIVTVQPREWKGTVDADVMTDRIKERWMLPGEHAVVDLTGCKKNEAHNVFDSIGIGISLLNKLKLRAT